MLIDELKLGESKEGQEGQNSGDAPNRPRYRPRHPYDQPYRNKRRSGSNQQQQSENGAEGADQQNQGEQAEGGAPRMGGRTRGGVPPRRTFRRNNYRGGRNMGPPRRPRSQDGQVLILPHSK